MVSVPAVLSVVEKDGAVRVCATLFYRFHFHQNLTIVLSTNDGTGIIFLSLCDKI